MYTDPGVFQMILAAIVGSLIALPAFLFIARDKIRSWINAILRRNKE